MWFRFPAGTTNVTIHQQQFKIEATDQDGVNYFRVPDHFAPLLLMINGFEVGSPPENTTTLGDLPKEDIIRDSAIASMVKVNEALKQEVENLRRDLDYITSKNTQLVQQNEDFIDMMNIAEEKIQALEKEIESLTTTTPEELKVKQKVK